MNRNTKRNVKIALLGIIAVISAGVIFSDTDSILASDGVKFSIPYPDELNFAGQTPTNSNASILCTLKQVTYGIDSTGGTVATVNSKALQGNPLLSITTTTGVKMAGYVIEPKIFCANTFNDDNLASPDKFTFIIDTSSMIIQVTSTNKDGSKVGTHSSSFTTRPVSIPIGGGEQSLGTVGVYSSNIEDDLSDGSYGTINQFDLRGNVVVYWKGYSGIKYTIPVKFGDVTSYHNAKIEKGSTGSGVYTGDDNDGDGIKNSYDKCPTVAENYNGFEDSNGCPDTAPVTTPPVTQVPSVPAPIIYTECIKTHNTWLFDPTLKTQSKCMQGGFGNISNGECGFGIETVSAFTSLNRVSSTECYAFKNKIDATTGCVTLTDNSKMCPTDSIFKSGGSCFGKDMDLCVYNKELALGTIIHGDGSPIGSIPSDNRVSGTIFWSAEVSYTDKTTDTLKISEDKSPFKFSIPLSSLTGGLHAGQQKQISQITLHPVLLMDNVDVQKKTSTSSSTLTYIVNLSINGAWKEIKGATSVPDFAPTQGATHTGGISLGNIIIKVADINSAIPATEVGLNDPTDVPAGQRVGIGGSAEAQLAVVLSGNFIINYNDGKTVKPLTVSTSIITDKAYPDGKIKELSSGDTKFVWTNLTFARGTSSHTGGSEPAPAQKCPVGETGFLIDSVLICKPKGTTVIDIENNGIIDTSSGGNCAGLTPDQCLAQGKSNPENGGQSGGGCKIGEAGCEICTDVGAGLGGFPCDKGYRDNYCGGTTQCNAEPQSGQNIGGSTIVTNTGTIGTESCDTNTLSLATNSCLIVGETPEDDIYTTNNTCIDGKCTTSSDPNLIWYVAGALVLIGVIAMMLKRRR